MTKTPAVTTGASITFAGGVAVPAERPAVVMGYSGEILTFGVLERRSSQVARLLAQRGLSRGDHIAIMMENSPRYFEVLWGALRSGLYVTPVNSHLSPEEAGYIVGDCGAAALFASAAVPSSTSLPAEILDRVRVRIVVGGDAERFEPYEDALSSQPDDAPPVELGFPMFYSSGTTGRPKGIMRPLPTVDSWAEDPGVRRTVERYGFREGMVYLSPAPQYHSAPFTFGYIVQALGGTVVVMEKFDAALALELIERERVTHSQWVPTMFIRMLRLPDAKRQAHDLSSHELAIHAAAPCPVWAKRAMIEWWGPILYEYYAASEGHGSTGITSEEWLAHPGSVGRPVAGVLHIVDDEGNELPPGEAGQIYFAGGSGAVYHNDPDKTAESSLPGGLRTVGDMGYVDDEGWLFLTDRKSNMIVSGGVNIYPREIEDVLSQHPAVEDVAVFGVPNDEFGEEVKAVVQAAVGYEPDEALARDLLTYARQHLAGYKVPRSMDFEPDLPRTPTGKLLTRVIRERYWQGRGSRIV